MSLFYCLLCATFQHDHLLNQVFTLFNIKPDISLYLMKEGQDLFYLTTALLEQLKTVYLSIKPDYVIVQGDTTTSFCAALAAFYLNIKIAHVEAGLRTGNLQAPFPEEANRKIITALANLNFPPTALSEQALLRENVGEASIYRVGNTGIDALYWVEKQLKTGMLTTTPSLLKLITSCKEKKQKIVLLTAHRRESFGKTLIAIFTGIASFLKKHPDVIIVYPTHPNPQVLAALDSSGLRTAPNIIIVEPVAYHDLVSLLLACDWVITDSGGIQEEAASLGKKTIVLRAVTERTEGIMSGLAKLGGRDAQSVETTMLELYNDQETLMPRSTIYGDGTASTQIAAIITQGMNGAAQPTVITDQCL